MWEDMDPVFETQGRLLSFCGLKQRWLKGQSEACTSLRKCTATGLTEPRAGDNRARIVSLGDEERLLAGEKRAFLDTR